ncbi:hypothetical protein LCGC14_2584430 [marine sediment metagenome]|uniref:Antitoxin SocA-like Panacea domain-containing protein n=1 Tax=marine sediment metagenome TaxID=412755 RepID=A0A0F9B1D9_9ZZZZ
MPDEIFDIQLDAEDVVLLILEANERLLRKSSLDGITRLEKLIFLLENETDFEGVGTFFLFEPHNFGPFSKGVYEAIEFLEGCDLIEVRERSYPSLYATSDEVKLLSELLDSDVPDDSALSESQITERQFLLTDDGRTVATKIRNAVIHRRPVDVKGLDLVIKKYGHLSLNHLIRYVYRRYPAMTVKSIHPEAMPQS